MTTYFLAENFFNPHQFPSHTITGEDEATGYEVWHVANGRRHARDYYTPATANVGRYVQATCDRTRLANMLVIDRNSNLAGETVRLWASEQSAFTTYEEVTFTVPSNTYSGNGLGSGHPVRTEEGAVVVLFDSMAATYWRFEVDAMGANEKPKIGGLWLGRAFAPEITPLPWDDETRWLDRTELRRGIPSTFVEVGREASVNVMLRNEAEWEKSRKLFGQLFWRGHPMWYVPDSTHAERSWLGYAPSGSNGAPSSGRKGRDLVVTMTEYQPVRI